MINKNISILGIFVIVAVCQYAIAQTDQSTDEEPSGITSSGVVTAQDDRRLSNQEMRDRIYALETRLADEQSSIEKSQASLAEIQRQLEAYQGLADEIGNLRGELSSEREARLASEGALEARTEDLARRQSSQNDARIDSDEALSANIETLEEKVSGSELAIIDIARSAETNESEIAELFERVMRSEKDLAEQEQVLNGKFIDINNVVSTRTLYGGIAAMIFVLIIFLLGRRMVLSRQVLASQIADSSDSFEKKHVDLDLKLTELFERQLESVPADGAGDSGDGQPDHTLPLQVAAEINRMKKRLDNMPEGTKGVQPLAKALERLEEGLENKGYEIIELLGSKYDEGMTIKASFTKDDELDPGEQVITRVTKPQVNYNGTVIQVADVEVSFGE